MREIKHRAKPCYKGGKTTPWVYGTFKYLWQRRVAPGATDNGRLEHRWDKGCIVGTFDIEVEVLCETVGEYTGRKDLHGDEIYEGDIVRDHSDPMGTGDVGVVVYDADRAMFAIRYYGGTDDGITYGMYDCKQKELEVIGNIHDNPELLKGKD